MKFTQRLRKLPLRRGSPTRFWFLLSAALWLMLVVAIFSSIGLSWAAFWNMLPVAFWLMLLVAECALLILLVDRRRQGKQRPEVMGRHQWGNQRPDDNQAREAFVRTQDRFCDLFVELWCCAEKDEVPDGGRWQVLERWRERLERLQEPVLLNAWVEATGLSSSHDDAWGRRGATHWLRNLESWGLTRYQPPKVEINEQTLRHFHVVPRGGSGTAVVTSPSWSVDGVVLEKGHAVVESDHDG
jgi:hypothetical protein